MHVIKYKQLPVLAGNDWFLYGDRANPFAVQ